MNENQIKDVYERKLNEELEHSVSSLQLNANNINQDPAHLRDTFISAEREYVLHLLKKDSVREMIKEVNWNDSSEIFKIAEDIVYKVENNLIPYEEMEAIEIKLTILLTAIKDKVLVKILEHYPEYEQEEEKSFSRSR